MIEAVSLTSKLLGCVTPKIWSTVFVVLMVSGLCACQSGPQSEFADSHWFSEEAEQRAVEFVHDSGFRDKPYLPEITGGGVALIDVDSDNDLDLYFIQSGWHLADVDGSSAIDAKPNELYLNDGQGHFTRSSELGEAANTGYGMGATVGDYDNDGDADIYVTNYGVNTLLQNDGNGHFSDVTEQAGLIEPGWSTAAAFTDIDLDGDLDLFVVNYLRWRHGAELNCYSRGVPTYCLPTNYEAPAQDSLYVNNGDGTFTNMSTWAGLHTAYGNGLGVVPEDFNSDGRPDFFVANDTMVNQLWLNEGEAGFRNAAFEWGSAVDNHGIEKAGMGIDSADIDGDLDFDVIVVNFEGQTDSVFMNQGTYFRDETSRVGLGAGSRRFTRFGVAFADFNNDGWFDLMEANGKVDGDPTNPVDEFAEPNSLFRGVHKESTLRFEALETADGTSNPQSHTSRALAVGDLNNDGRLDAVIVNRDAKPYVLMNRIGGKAQWLQFRVLNRQGSDAIGATVLLKTSVGTRIQTVKVAGSYLSSHDPRVHFGFQQGVRIEEAVVNWLTGESVQLKDLSPNRLIEVGMPPNDIESS